MNVCADNNRPGILRDVEPVEHVEHDGHLIEAAFLVFDDRHGRTCRVYAERCVPAGASSIPGLVHCPGGGQTVGRPDLVDWAAKGFACASFDWQIGGFPAHDPSRKSLWPDGVVGQNQYIEDETEAILPLAIQAAGVCLDWLHASDRVRGDASGVAGISWGGYLAWLVAAYEPRIRAAVPVYGCGGQFDPRHPGAFRLHLAMARLWQDRWDPYTIGPQRGKPVCYLSGTNDFFGITPLADELLNRLAVPHRREWLPNANHCISPGGSALGLAWLRHYLADGPAVPEEPVLQDDFSVDAHRAADVVGTETWWTPALRDGDLGCWIRGRPGAGEAAAVLGRVHYRQGYTLSAPLRVADPMSRPVPPGVPAAYPDLRDGLGWEWNMSSTQFYGNRVTMEAVEPGRVRLTRDPGRADTAPGFFLNMPAHPGWNTGKQRALTLGLRTDPRSPLDSVSVTLALRGTHPVQVVTARLPVVDDSLTVDLASFPDFPAMFSWRSVVRMHVNMTSSAHHFIVGPLCRIDT